MAKGKAKSRSGSKKWSIAGVVTGGAVALALVAPFSQTIKTAVGGSTASEVWNNAMVESKTYWTNLSVGAVLAPIAVYAGGKALVGSMPLGSKVKVF